MNNRGFTLLELLITIALLAVISLISFVSVNKVIEQSKVKDCENLVLSIKSATKEYVSDNRYKSNFDSDGNMKVTISGNDLISGNYLTSTIVDPFTKSNITPSSIMIDIGLNSDYSAKSVDVKNSSGNKINCNNNRW